MTVLHRKPNVFVFFLLQRIFSSFVYTEKISNGESEVQQVRGYLVLDILCLCLTFGSGFITLSKQSPREVSCSYDSTYILSVMVTTSHLSSYRQLK